MRLITWADKLKPVSAVIKDKLSEFLADARGQRAHVIRAFKSAGHMLEAAGKGFGKCFWGNRWKHVLFEHFCWHGMLILPSNVVSTAPQSLVCFILRLAFGLVHQRYVLHLHRPRWSNRSKCSKCERSAREKKAAVK